MMTRLHSGFACVLLTALVACSSTARRETLEHDASANEARHRASLMLEAGAFADAVQTLEPLSRAAPKDDQLLVMLGDAYRGTGDFESALKSYEQAIRLNYGDYRPHLKLGVLLMEHQKTGRALTEFEVAVKFGRDDALAHYNYGLALNELGHKPEALEQWRGAREIDPGNANYVEAVGIGLTGVDDSVAVECFRDCERLGLKDASFYNNYALALERIGANDEAERWFAAAVASRDDRREEEYRRNLALHYLRVGRNEDAARAFEALIANYGAKWSSAVYLARARVALSRYDEAIAALDSFAEELHAGKVDRSSARIDRVPPTAGEALDVLGMAWRGRGDKARAVEFLGRAVVAEPDDPSHLNNYGVVLAENGKLQDARTQWRRVLEIDPSNATARANLAAFAP